METVERPGVKASFTAKLLISTGLEQGAIVAAAFVMPPRWSQAGSSVLQWAYTETYFYCDSLQFYIYGQECVYKKKGSPLWECWKLPLGKSPELFI